MSVSPVKKRVSYFYDSSMGNYNYGYRHCMKPHRIRIIHDLLMSYGLGQKMEIYRPQKATAEDMTKFHSDEYIRFLERIRPDNKDDYNEQMQRFNLNSDCPIFDGLYEFCQLSVGGSVSAAVVLNKKSADICINWGGGFHHAKNVKASGFCYVNDIVLGILELLKHHQRVLYIDIDVHHGDGVEEAFFTTDRVMTVSFHQYDGVYFPGTGDLGNIGAEKGKYYALNVPLQYGIDDDSYESIFVPIITNVMASFQPSAVVLQCGADSLAGDKLGYFNLTVKGHGKCVEFVKRFEIPLLLVGGGGYTLKNVTRCWTYETAVALGVEIANELPSNEHLKHFGPDYKLHTNPSKRIINKNNKKSLEEIKSKIFENLRMLPHAPAVQIQDIPEDGECHDLEYKDNVNPDERNPQSITDKRIAPDNEFSDSDDERMVPGVRGSERKDNRSFKTVAPARKQACLDSNRMEVDEPEFNMLRAQTSLMSNAHTLCIETSGEITNNLKDELDIDNQITNNRQLGDQFMLAETQDNSEEEDDSKQFMYLLYKQNVLSINDDEDEGIGLTSSNDNNTQKNQSPIPGSSKGPLMTTTATDEIIDLDNYVVNEVPSRFNLDNQKSEGRLPKIKKSLSALKKQHSAPVPPPVPIQQSLHSRGRLPLFPNVTFLRTTSDPNAFIVRLAMDNIDRTFAEKITDYEIFLCIENGEMSGNWSHISTVKAAPLPVDYTLCKHLPGMKYYISVRSVDTYHQVGPFCPAKLVC